MFSDYVIKYYATCESESEAFKSGYVLPLLDLIYVKYGQQSLNCWWSSFPVIDLNVYVYLCLFMFIHIWLIMFVYHLNEWAQTIRFVRLIVGVVHLYVCASSFVRLNFPNGHEQTLIHVYVYNTTWL